MTDCRSSSSLALQPSLSPGLLQHIPPFIPYQSLSSPPAHAQFFQVGLNIIYASNFDLTFLLLPKGSWKELLNRINQM
jgi:hypothetical protein